MFQTVDFLAVVGLLGSIAFAAWCIAKRRPGPVEVTVGLFAVLGLVLGDAVYMTEAYGFARPVSSLLLFVIVTAVKERLWWGLLPSLMMTASIGLFFVAPPGGLLRDCSPADGAIAASRAAVITAFWKAKLL